MPYTTKLVHGNRRAAFKQARGGQAIPRSHAKRQVPKYRSVHVGWEGEARWLRKFVAMDCVESRTYGSKVASEIGGISIVERRTHGNRGTCSRRVVIQTLVLRHDTLRRKAMSFPGITTLYSITGVTEYPGPCGS